MTTLSPGWPMARQSAWLAMGGPSGRDRHESAPYHLAERSWALARRPCEDSTVSTPP